MQRNWTTAPTTKVAPPALRQSRRPAWTQACALLGSNAVIMTAAVKAGTIRFMTKLPCCTQPGRLPHPLQVDLGDAGRDVDAGLALNRQRLQFDGAVRPADQDICSDARADRRLHGSASVGAGKRARR